MQTLPRAANPFALLLNPQAVIAQIEGSERLERLHRRVCRPLDKPLLGGAADGESADSADTAEGTLEGDDADSSRAL
jgi:hypothetical protein